MKNSTEDDNLLIEGSRSGGLSRRNKQMIVGGVAVIVSVSLVVVLVLIFAVVPARTQLPKRNVIMMISDGWGPASATLTRTYSNKPLNLDPYLVGTVRTFSSSSLVTDSAAGATAYSCGKHTYNIGVGVDQNGKACGTVLEAAARKGMRTGVVSTTRVTDATPAAFCSHSADRGFEDYIASQELDLVGFEKHMDVILGGGRAKFLASARADGQDLLAKAAEKGYKVVLNATGLDELKAGDKVLGLFSDGNMGFAIDRKNNATLYATQPSLVTMARKALELLSNEEGFFVMLEGALIDICEHNNDAAGSVNEVLGYDETFAMALEFAKEHGNTVIISTSDHETGGLTLGLQTNTLPGGYADYAYYPHLLAAFNASTDSMANRVLAGEDIRSVIASSTNITDITDAEVALIQTYKTLFDTSGAIGKIVASRSLIGWTTHGHTGVDVNLYVYGLPEDFHFSGGNIENIDVAALIAELLGLDLATMTDEVFNFPTNTTAARQARVAHDHSH